MGWVGSAGSRVYCEMPSASITPTYTHIPQWQHGDITIATRDAGAKPLYESYEDALKNINCQALIMPTRTDQYFPVSVLRNDMIQVWMDSYQFLA